MNQNIQKWIDALRSDLYDQNFEDWQMPIRTSNNKFSVIGVLCNVHAQEHPDVAKTQMISTEYLGYEYMIPKKVQDWIGISNCSFEFIYPFTFENRVYESADQMSCNFIPFYIIADAIELQLQ